MTFKDALVIADKALQIPAGQPGWIEAQDARNALYTLRQIADQVEALRNAVYRDGYETAADKAYWNSGRISWE